MYPKLDTKPLGHSDLQISALGLGCMGLSEFYGAPTSKEAARALIHHALDLGVTLLDTADVYGGGHNESLLATALEGRRDEAVIATKFGIVREGGGYARTICGRPEYARRACHESLRRLNTDYIDLYYVHRIDAETPIEETIGALSRLVEEGKIRAIGLSEASPETLRRAHAVHPISALQSEYSMMTRAPEAEILGLTRELGVTFVPYSPICRGLLSAHRVPADDPADVRRFLPRFQGEAYTANQALAAALEGVAHRKGCSLAQLSLAWVMAQGAHVTPIPGTTKRAHLDANAAAAQIKLDATDLGEIEALLSRYKVEGARYTAEGMKGISL